MNRPKNKGNVYWMALLLFMLACSVEKNYKTLAFFFDGVPDPELARVPSPVDSLLLTSADTVTDFSQVTSAKSTIHPPYREKNCTFCHNEERMGNLKAGMPGLCYQCHTALAGQLPYEHGPAASGYCIQCHYPHYSKEENLLVKTGSEMCFNCHEPERLYKGIFHSAGDKTDCIKCHNPHGSDNHSLLQKGTCYRCHENPAEKYQYVHGPVAEELCSACHATHRSGNDKFLLREGRELCLYCHVVADIMKNENHAETENVFCTECHNPHGGSERYMFN